MSKLTNLVAKQNEEIYQLGKKHGAIEELVKIKNELKENTKHTTALEWSNNRLQKMLNDHIKILKGENK